MSGDISVALLSMGGSNFIKNIFISVPKMNEGLTGLEQHEGEKLMAEFSFWGELTL